MKQTTVLINTENQNAVLTYLGVPTSATARLQPHAFFSLVQILAGMAFSFCVAACWSAGHARVRALVWVPVHPWKYPSSPVEILPLGQNRNITIRPNTHRQTCTCIMPSRIDLYPCTIKKALNHVKSRTQKIGYM